MKLGIFGVIALFLISIIAINVNAATVPVTIVSVTIDGETITVNDTNRLSLERNQEIEVKVKLTATGNTSNVEIEAFLSGYESNDKVTDTTSNFDVETGVIYIKKLSLDLPEKLDEDDYKLRIMISDRNNDEVVQNYNLKIESTRHGLKIKDVIINPETNVKAGRYITALVRVKNIGQKDEESVKITVSIPDLGISASDYIDEIESGDTKTSEEIQLKIPKDAEEGTYDVEVTVKDDYTTLVETSTIEVEGADADEGRTVLTIGPESQDIAQSEKVVYTMTITNEGSNSKSYTLSVAGLDNMGTVELSPANVVVVGAGQTIAVYIYVTADDSASVGANIFTLTVSSSGQVLQQIPLTANVVEGENLTTLKGVLEVSLIILVVLLVVLGLVIGFKKMKTKNEGEESADDAGQTYY